MAKIGLVAGSGKLPIIFAESAKGKGETVIGFGIKGITDEGLEAKVDKMHWLAWGDLKKAMALLLLNRIGKIVLLGKIAKGEILNAKDALDEEAKAAVGKIGDRKDYAIFNGVAGALKKIGVEVLDSTVYFKDLIPQKGVITKRSPTKEESEDIKYGETIARQIAGFDIGQTVAVKNRTAIAIEAIEGTDGAIARAGGLVKGGFVVVKTARPDQDMRFDVPLIGPDTIRSAIKAGATAFALESGKTILMDKEELIKLADYNNLSVVII